MFEEEAFASAGASDDEEELEDSDSLDDGIVDDDDNVDDDEEEVDLEDMNSDDLEVVQLYPSKATLKLDRKATQQHSSTKATLTILHRRCRRSEGVAQLLP